MQRVRAGEIQLAYRIWGHAQNPPLVLLHALGEASADWAQAAEELAPAWRVCAPDLRGHGASDWPGGYCGCHEARLRRNIRLCRRVPSRRMRWSGWTPRSVAPSLRIAAADRPFRSSVRN